MAFRLSPEARLDIDDIWGYIAQDDPSAATQFTTMLLSKCTMLARHPHMGRLCPFLRPDLYRFTVGNYIIFYRIRAGHIEIVRLLHGARDISAFFPADDE